MALGDKVESLQQTVTILSERVSNLLATVEALKNAHTETSRHLADLRRDHDRVIALLNQDLEHKVALLNSDYQSQLALFQREIDDLKRWKEDQKKQAEERTRRWWAFGPNLLAAVIGGLISAAIAYFIRRP